jgi:CheY-like chemotaxis protein
VKSTVEQGSTFSFALTFTKTTEEAGLEATLLELDPGIRNINVLVVEDMPLNQLLMKTLLDDFGFQSDIAGNGRIAIEKLESTAYDIVLMDLQMPEMNGFEAAVHIRNKLNLKIPIIALTADVTTVDLEKCRSAGMNDYIAKPVDERLLYSKIVSFVKRAADQKAVPVAGIPEKINTTYVDLNFLKRRTKSNPVLMTEMITLYLKQTPPLVEAMKLSLRDKDWKTLYKAAHKMVPSFSIMGMNPEFENMAKKIQESAHHQQPDGISDLVMELETACMKACNELETELSTIKNGTNVS